MPTRVEQLLADPAVRQLPAHLREPLLKDAIAADVADSQQPEGTVQATIEPNDLQTGTRMQEQLQQPGYASPGYQGLGAYHEGGTIETPASAEPRYEQQRQAQRIQDLKVRAAPMIGSTIGTAVLGPLGDILGTGAGYGFNL